jgi:methyl-accepting chemotaxis protein
VLPKPFNDWKALLMTLNFFSHGTVSQRLNRLTAAFLVGTGSIVLVGVWALLTIDQRIQWISEGALPGLDHSGRVSNAIGKYRSDVWKHIAATTVEAKREVEKHQESVLRVIDGEFAAYEGTITIEEDRRNFANLKGAWGDYLSVWTREVKPASREGTAEGNAKAYEIAASRGKLAFERAANELERVIEWNSQRGKELATESHRAEGEALSLFVGLGLVAVLGGIGLAWLIGSNLKRSLGQVANELSSSGTQVRSAAVQVAQSSATLARGATDQAASIEETSASCSEISSMATHNELNAEAAIQSLRASQVQFADAEEKLGRLVEAMDDINGSSKKIGQILGTIDTIAFQTNIWR